MTEGERLNVVFNSAPNGCFANIEVLRHILHLDGAWQCNLSVVLARRQIAVEYRTLWRAASHDNWGRRHSPDSYREFNAAFHRHILGLGVAAPAGLNSPPGIVDVRGKFGGVADDHSYVCDWNTDRLR